MSYTDRSDRLTRILRKQQVKGYINLIQDRMKDGYIAYFANFMFNQLPGEYETRLTIMEKEVQRFHGILTRHVVRKPESKAWKPLCPSLIGCPDAPVRKLRGKAQRVMGSVANDGWHYNGIILVPPRRRDTGGKTVRDAGGRASRLEVGLIMHVASMERQYLNRRLQRIHVTRCRSAEMVDYVFKTFKAGRVSLDRILVLERVRSTSITGEIDKVEH